MGIEKVDKARSANDMQLYFAGKEMTFEYKKHHK